MDRNSTLPTWRSTTRATRTLCYATSPLARAGASSQGVRYDPQEARPIGSRRRYGAEGREVYREARQGLLPQDSRDAQVIQGWATAEGGKVTMMKDISSYLAYRLEADLAVKYHEVSHAIAMESVGREVK